MHWGSYSDCCWFSPTGALCENEISGLFCGSRSVEAEKGCLWEGVGSAEVNIEWSVCRSNKNREAHFYSYGFKVLDYFILVWNWGFDVEPSCVTEKVGKSTMGRHMPNGLPATYGPSCKPLKWKPRFIDSAADCKDSIYWSCWYGKREDSVCWHCEVDATRGIG